MTKLWLDTESNSFGGELISAALVAEDGRYWYKSLTCADPVPWVTQHVIPMLGIKAVPIKELQASLSVFLSQFERITIIADWPVDIEHFCRLLSLKSPDGRIIETPPITFELKTWLNGEGESAIPHNALEDAKAIMRYDLSSK